MSPESRAGFPSQLEPPAREQGAGSHEHGIGPLAPVVALSLGGLRCEVEVLMLPDNLDVRLILNRGARRKRDRRRSVVRTGPSF
jgi:hypothetical protein